MCREEGGRDGGGGPEYYMELLDPHRHQVRERWGGAQVGTVGVYRGRKHLGFARPRCSLAPPLLFPGSAPCSPAPPPLLPSPAPLLWVGGPPQPRLPHSLWVSSRSGGRLWPGAAPGPPGLGSLLRGQGLRTTRQQAGAQNHGVGACASRLQVPLAFLWGRPLGPLDTLRWTPRLWLCYVSVCCP